MSDSSSAVIDPVHAPVTRLRDLSSQQWKSGAAAWLGWLFDGLDMHLYTIVAAPFVAQLLFVAEKDPLVTRYSSWIQAAFLVGWALGGAVFGRIGDKLGRSRTLVLTILTYAMFTGLSYFATDWWHLMIFRFLAALGIGGEWAVGASLLSETWPKQWRPWIAAVLQSAVNIGVLLASLAGYLLSDFSYNSIFLVGILPALLTLWIRRAVPETEQWEEARQANLGFEPRIRDLFRGSVRRITVLTILVCSFSLTAHWAFMFWYSQQLRGLPDIAVWTEAEKTRLVSWALMVVMVSSVVGNVVAAIFARRMGYRRAIALLCLTYFGSMLFTYLVPRTYTSTLYCLPLMGMSSGVFALFTMYLPPLFPTLLRTTGAGFSYNIGRLAAAAGTIYFGWFAKVGDYRLSLLYAGFLFLPAVVVALFMPEPPDEMPLSVTPEG